MQHQGHLSNLKYTKCLWGQGWTAFDQKLPP